MRVRPILKFFMIMALMCFVAVVAWAWGSGYRVYSISTTSMEPAYHKGDAVLVRPRKRAVLPGDVITFRLSASSPVMTERVVSVDGEHIVTKGDNETAAAQTQVTPAMVIGHAVSRLPNVGYVFTFFKQSVGVTGLIAGVLAIILLWQICFPEEEPTVTVTVPSKLPLYASRPAPPSGTEYAVTQDAFGRRHVLAVSRRDTSGSKDANGNNANDKSSANDNNDDKLTPARR